MTQSLESVIDSTLNLSSSYWRSTESSKWSATGFLGEVLQSDPTIVKRSAIAMLSNDLLKLHSSFISNKTVAYKIKSIQISITKNKEQINNFWRDNEDTLRQYGLSAQMDLTRAKRAYEHTVAVAVERSHPIEPVVRIKKSKTVDMITERDQVFVEDQGPSVGTVIKQAAVKIHRRYTKGTSLTSRERKIMVCGLSSILDLGDDSFESQRSLFSESAWTKLKERFTHELAIPLPSIEPKVMDIITICINTLQLSNDYEYSLNYLENMRYKLLQEPSSANIIKGFHCLIAVIYKHPRLLNPTPTKQITELDYLRLIWSPLLEALVGNNARLKTGESVSAYTTSCKQDLYHDSSHVRGFKIDFRLIMDLDNGEEIDLCVGECAKPANDDKLVEDEAKLAREAKDSLDMMITSTDSDYAAVGYSIQTAGSSMSIYSIHLVVNGLYVMLHRYTFTLTVSIDGLQKDIGELMQHLSCIVNYINRTVGHITYINGNKSRIDHSFNRSTSNINQRLRYLRDTYYSPPRGAVSKIPRFLSSPPPIEQDRPNSAQKSIAEEVLPNDLAEDALSKELADDEGYDKAGYKILSDGRVYNKFVCKFVEYHP